MAFIAIVGEYEDAQEIAVRETRDQALLQLAEYVITQDRVWHPRVQGL